MIASLENKSTSTFILSRRLGGDMMGPFAELKFHCSTESELTT